MNQQNLATETMKLEKYLVKQGRGDFIQEMRSATPETLEAKLLALAKHNQEISNTMGRDDKLAEAKRRKADLEAPYKDQKKMNAKLARFVALMMQEQGLVE